MTVHPKHNHGDDLSLTLASQALLMAVLDQLDLASRMVQMIYDRYGPQAVHDALMLWTDTYTNLHGPLDDDVLLELSFSRVGADDNVSADHVPPPVAWAGRFIAARVARDDDQTRALLGSLPTDPRMQGDAVWALLTGCAMNMRSLVGQL